MSMSSAAPQPPASGQQQGWQLTVLDQGSKEEELELHAEIERLEAVLRDEVGEWEKRLGDINEELKGKK